MSNFAYIDFFLCFNCQFLLFLHSCCEKHSKIVNKSNFLVILFNANTFLCYNCSFSVLIDKIYNRIKKIIWPGSSISAYFSSLAHQLCQSYPAISQPGIELVASHSPLGMIEYLMQCRSKLYEIVCSVTLYRNEIVDYTPLWYFLFLFVLFYFTRHLTSRWCVMKMIHSCFLNSTHGSLELHFCIFQMGVFKGRRKKGIFLATRKCYVQKTHFRLFSNCQKTKCKGTSNHSKSVKTLSPLKRSTPCYGNSKRRLTSSARKSVQSPLVKKIKYMYVSPVKFTPSKIRNRLSCKTKSPHKLEQAPTYLNDLYCNFLNNLFK